MIVGVGCDIIEIERIARAIKRESFIRRVFTAEEAAYCQRRGQQAAASFAARFAAKEAVLKALGAAQRSLCDAGKTAWSKKYTNQLKPQQRTCYGVCDNGG